MPSVVELFHRKGGIYMQLVIMGIGVIAILVLVYLIWILLKGDTAQ